MTRINEAAAKRIEESPLTGSSLLQMFKLIEAEMTTIGAEGNFVQFQFVQNVSELKEGDLIPEIHMSLRPVTMDELQPVQTGKITVDE